MHNVQSPRADDSAIESRLIAKGLTAPRVTPADFEANIVDTEIVKHVSRSGQVLRWAIITTASGFAVTGRPSASVSSENDDEETGVQVATANARNELWPLMGYALREKLAATPSNHQDRVRAERDRDQAELDRLAKFIAESPTWAQLSDAERNRMGRQARPMFEKIEILNERIAAFPTSE